MTAVIPIGLRHTETLRVDDSLTVPAHSAAFPGFADMPPVFATASLVAFIESTCIEALRPYLTAAQRTVGIHIDVSHSAATAIGLQITAEVELVAMKGSQLNFDVRCHDDINQISEGRHERYIIDTERFTRNAAEKARRARIEHPVARTAATPGAASPALA
jgi:fluoroacetyl-CoA thioesterase